LDVLAVALQPILARAQTPPAPIRFSVLVDGGERVDVTVEAPDLAAAVAKAVRQLEREGRRVRGLEIADR
ncbi:MAG TPA: hypothetical protein VIU44_13395, partial [Gaiellaceae bacterium]